MQSSIAYAPIPQTISDAAPPPPDPVKLTESALQYAFRVVLPRANASASRRLGYAAPPQARMLTRSAEVMQDLAREFVDSRGGGAESLRAATEVMQLDDAVSTGSSWTRLERELADERAVALVQVVHALPTPLRTVLVLRALGRPWAAVYRALPGRARWSVAEDYGAALRRVWAEADDLVLGVVG